MPAAVLTIAQQKGGAGKTTLAAHLSVALAAGGMRVAAIDIDPQGSLSHWAGLRRARLGEGRAPEVLTLSGWRLPGALDRLRGTTDIVLVDSPPHAESDARTAIRGASLVLAPVQPSPVDLWASKATLELARAEARPVLLVVNRMPPRTALAQEMVATLAAAGIAVAAATLGNRVAFAASLAEGLGVTEHQPGGAAAEEIRLLAAEITARLAAAPG